MHSIAKALVLATQFVAKRDDHCDVDRDVQLLEDVAYVLRQASPAERDALISAAQELGFPAWPEEMGIVS